MPGKSSAERRALEAQNARIMRVFEDAGFDHIAPDILQPADIFLERSGEDIRANSYVFTDPEGQEMCLRPDLTVPACRYHLTHAAKPDSEARYCYCGPAFRFTSDQQAPSEFGQAGIEWLAARVQTRRREPSSPSWSHESAARPAPWCWRRTAGLRSGTRLPGWPLAIGMAGASPSSGISSRSEGGEGWIASSFIWRFL